MTHEQLSIDWLTPTEADAGRAEAIERVDAHADVDWKAAAADAVRWCALHHETFTADEVLERLAALGAPGTHNLAALGPVFQRAARAGLITKTGTQRLSRLRQRHRDLTVWTRSVIDVQR